jgi:peptidylprolyl isomerase
MDKKSIVVIMVVIVIAIIGFVLSLRKMVSPANEEKMDLQSEINKIKENQDLAGQSAKKIDESSQLNVQSEIDKMKGNQGAASQPVASQASQSSASTNSSNVPDRSKLIQIKTTQPGTGDRAVKNGDTIGVYYTGKLTDGTTFDSNVGSGKPFEFTVGAGMVIKGWEQGFIDAKIGEKRTLTIPSNLGYGAAGAGSVIPPNATLIFDVELVSIK